MNINEKRRTNYRETSKQSKKGTHWYNNGLIEIMLYEDEEIPEGYIRGKIKGRKRKKNKVRQNEKKIIKMQAEIDVLKQSNEDIEKRENMSNRERKREDAIAIIKRCWMNGASDIEASQVAGIHYNTLCGWLHGRDGNGTGKIEGLLEEKELLKSKPSYKARTNIVGAIDEGDIETSKWYLERKNPDEFSTKSKQEIDVTSNGKSIEEKQQEMLEALANIK